MIVAYSCICLLFLTLRQLRPDIWGESSKSFSKQPKRFYKGPLSVSWPSKNSFWNLNDHLDSLAVFRFSFTFYMFNDSPGKTSRIDLKKEDRKSLTSYKNDTWCIEWMMAWHVKQDSKGTLSPFSVMSWEKIRKSRIDNFISTFNK